MKLFTVTALVGLLGGTSSLAFAQSRPQLDQKVGNCSVIQNGTGNTVSLNCDNIDATLAKQIQEILNGTRQNTSASKDISEKLDRIINHMDQADARPLVGLKFIGSKGPGVACVNESDVMARDMLLQVVLWNRDTLELQPLPIPTQKCDWLRPHDEGAPYDLSRWLAQLKPGTHLIGSAMISCPNCITGRTYVVSIILGDSGWFSEVNPGPGQQGRVFVPHEPNSEVSCAKFLDALEGLVPVDRRLPIPDQFPK